jgi:hypothetical protein
MKRFLLSAASAFLAVYGFAQSPAAKVSTEILRQSVSIPVHTVINQNPTNPNGTLPTGMVGTQRNAQETVIGQSTYDLQSNSAIQRRIINHDNGTVSATWTYSSVNSWATRGTGYNFFNGNVWGTPPTSEIETERTGWPSLLVTASGREVILSHSTVSNLIRQSSRNSIGSGTWTQANIASSNVQVWNRAGVGGPAGNTIHMVGVSAPVANGGTLYNGMDGAFLYNRSSNGGLTWDINNYQIPGTDSSYFSSFDGDSYHLDVQGNTVAIVVGGLGTGVQLFKSTNNGVTWTKTDVLLSAIMFDEATSLVSNNFDSALVTSDGTVNVLIDDNDQCHVWYGAMRIANDVVGDGPISYFPGTNSIEYWNESMMPNQPVSLTGALDINGNGTLDVLTGAIGTDIGQYRFSGLASHPQAGIDSNGCIYVVYSAIREDLGNGDQLYRHTYVIRSCDNGCSWSFPIDVTDVSGGSNNFKECVYASIARKVDDKIHVIYMSDIYPGIAVSGDGDDPGANDFIYLTEDSDRFDTVSFCPSGIAGDSTVCPGFATTLYAVGCASAYAWTGPNGFTASTQSISAGTPGTYTCTFTNVCGTSVETFDVVAATGNNGPIVQITSDVQIMCPADTANLTATSSVAGSFYSWNTTETTPSIQVYLPGTYTVTVTDCNGSTVENFVISQPTNAPAAVVSGETSICPGETIVLSALPVAGGTYTWSNGDQTRETSVSAAGTYTCIVQNCGGTSQASITVVDEAAPVATILAPSLVGCEGDGLTLTAGGGTSFVWSNGATAASINLTSAGQSGTYTVTVSNDCGETDTEQVTVTINAQPSAPVITFNGTAYVSSQSGAGTHAWFVNGNQVAGATGSQLNIFTASGAPVVKSGDLVYAIYTDENECSSSASATLLGVEDAAAMSNNVSLYPNPSNGQFEIRFGDVSGKVTIEVTNLVGQVVYNNVISANNGHVENMDLSNLKGGVYQISISGDAGKTVENIVIK